MNSKKVKVFLLSFMLFSFVAYSKKKPPTPEEGGAPPPPVGLPIDGGLSLLLVSGVTYGIYTLTRKKE